MLTCGNANTYKTDIDWWLSNWHYFLFSFVAKKVSRITNFGQNEDKHKLKWFSFTSPTFLNLAHSLNGKLEEEKREEYYTYLYWMKRQGRERLLNRSNSLIFAPAVLFCRIPNTGDLNRRTFQWQRNLLKPRENERVRSSI